jgi:thiosulfate/3-mercaptopyruvate sulfurtransferase
MTQKCARAGLIQPSELYALMERGVSVRMVDASYVLDGSKPFDRYLKERIGDAVFFDIEAVSDKSSSLPHMLPSPDMFQEAVSALGISNDDFIVVYGQGGPHMGPARVWWTFRTFGHDNICVLDGGLTAWIAEGFPVNGAAPPEPKHSGFKTTRRSDYTCELQDVKKAADSGSCAILDARPPPRFQGAAPEPRPGLKSGHIPGSKSTPAVDFIDSQTGKFKSMDQILEIIHRAGLKDGKAPVIATCGSGVTACLIVLALYMTNYDGRISVYDGSWAEWGQPALGLAIETG